ncbi:MAG TPA: alpha/beta fold hydrolase [Acetobacteraceae bacterium]|nr:alpha/beta fold hydrolase [Acetobacteraceae bacterium]
MEGLFMILAARETGSGPTLCLLHGLFGAARNFGAVQRRLAARFRVVALDLRNHGASPHAEGMSYMGMAEDVRETLAAMGALPAMILGHSMGGKVAMRLALAHEEAAQGLVVADIAPVPYPPHHRGMTAAMLNLPLGPGLTRQAADAALAPSVPDPQVRGFLLQNLLVGETPSWRNGLAQIADAMAEIEDFPLLSGARYKGPALFVAGERSDYIRPEHHAAIRALFPKAEFATVPGAGHWLHADNLEGLLAVIEPFFREWAPA